MPCGTVEVAVTRAIPYLWPPDSCCHLKRAGKAWVWGHEGSSVPAADLGCRSCLVSSHSHKLVGWPC